nr:phosphopyruvate hydratase - Deinococcus radiodurans (strain R1) [Deinococcus radiodurans]
MRRTTFRPTSIMRPRTSVLRLAGPTVATILVARSKCFIGSPEQALEALPASLKRQPSAGGQQRRTADGCPEGGALAQRLAAREHGSVAELVFDAQQLVVLGDTVRAAGRAGLDLPGVGRHSEVGDKGVFGLARAVADDGAVVVALGEFDGVHALGEGADLVHLDQNRVAHLAVDALLQALGVGHEQVVAHQLGLGAHLGGQAFPAVPVVFSEAVFDADNRVAAGPVGPEVDHLVAAQHAALALQVVLAVLVQLGHGGVERDADVLAGFVARLLNGFKQHFEGFLVALEVRRKTAFVADVGVVAAPAEDFFQVVKGLGAVAQCFTEARSADRHHHELLKIHAVVGVGAAVDDVHHGHRQGLGVGAAEVAVERDVELGSGGAGSREAHRQNRVAAHVALVGGAVHVHQRLVDGGLLTGVHADEGRAEGLTHVLHGTFHALAHVPLAAVTQFERLVAAGTRSRRHDGPARKTAVEVDFGFDGGVPTRIQHFTGDDFLDVHDP